MLMTLILGVRCRACTDRIPPQRAIRVDLFMREQSFHLDMGVQMRQAQIALKLGDLFGQMLESL
jgi:cell division protein FtsW (lipid II flippase)